MHETKVSDTSTNTDMSFQSSGNVSAEATQESTEIDNHINTHISENSDDSFHLPRTESETDDKDIQNSQCNNILTQKKYILSLSSIKSILVFCQECKKPAHITKPAEKGFLLKVFLLCEDNHDTCWYS